jgi:hypothetical protein
VSTRPPRPAPPTRHQAIDVFGGMLPIVVAAYATGGLGAAALGGSQSAGHQAMSSDDALQSMFD